MSSGDNLESVLFFIFAFLAIFSVQSGFWQFSHQSSHLPLNQAELLLLIQNKLM